MRDDMTKFTIGTAEMKKVISQIEPMFKGGMNNMPRILFKVDENITASATNGESYTKIVFDAKTIEETGSFVVPGEKFATIVKKSTSSEIQFVTMSNEQANDGEKSENRLLIVAGKVKYQIALIDTQSEYFEAPEFDGGKSFTISAQELKSAISAVNCCIDPAKQHLNCVLLHSNEGEEGKIYAVATDGMRLGIAERKATFSTTIPNLLVPAKAAQYIVSMIGEMSGDINVNYTENLIQVSTGKIFYTSKLLDTSFPKYRAVVPQGNNKILEVKVSDLKNAIDEITSVSEITFRIKLAIFENRVEISCEDNGDNSVGEVEATFSEAKNMEVVCNYRLLKDIITNISSSLVRIQISDPSTPLLIRSVDDSTIQYIFMPFVS